MNKLLIEVIVPSIEQNYDILVPKNKKIGKILRIIIKTINELSDGYFPIKYSISIIDANTGEQFDLEKLVKDSEIKNGCRINII